MANKILLKRSGTQNKVPLTSDLSLGELSVNTYDGRLYTLQNAGSNVIRDLSQNDPITISGDVVTATSTNPSAGNAYSNLSVTLSSTGVVAGNYGSATSIPTIVVDAKGRITSLTTNAVSTTINLSGTSGTGSVSGGGTLTFAGTYGVTATASSSTITIGTPQDLQTTASPTFTGLYSTTSRATNFSSPNVVISGGYISALTNASITTDFVTTGYIGTAYVPVLNATNGNIQSSLFAGSLSTANAVISGGYISALTNAYVTTSAITNLSTANILVSGGSITGLTNLGATTAVATNLSTGNILVSGGSITGLTNLGATTAVATNFSSGNAVISGGYISALSNAYVTTGYFTNLSSANISQVTQFGATTGVITNFSTGNAQITGGTITGLTNLGATTAVATNFSSGNAVISGGYISGLSNVSATYGTFTNFYSGNINGSFNGTVFGTVSTANVSLYDSVTALTTNQTFYPQFSNISTTGNSITGVATNLTFNPSTGVLSATQFSGTGNFTTAVATNFSSGNAVISGGYISSLSNAYVTTGYFTNLSSANISQVTQFGATTGVITNFSSGNVAVTGGFATGLTNVYATTSAVTNLSTGNILVSGGSITGLTNLGATTAVATNFSTGNAVISGAQTYIGSAATPIANATINTTSVITATAVTENVTNGNITTLTATNLYSGNARIASGFADNFKIGANTATTGAFTTLSASGQTNITNATNATNYQTGALVVSGGMGVAKDVYIQGNLYVANVIASTTSELIVNDPLLYLTANTIFPYNYDIGTFSQFRGGSANVYQHTGVVRSSTNGYWGFFSNVITEPSSTINWADTSLIWDPIKAGTLTLANTVGTVLSVSGNTAIDSTLYARGVYDNTNRVVSTSTGAGNLTISGTAINLTATGPGAVTTGSANYIPVITTDAYGRIASLANTAISLPFSSITATPTTLSGYGITDALSTSSTIDGGTY